MTIRVLGILVDPTDTPIPNAIIRATALENSSVLLDAVATITTDAGGRYDFNLVNGKYRLDVNQKSKYNKVAYVEVTDSTADPSTLPELIENNSFMP